MQAKENSNAKLKILIEIISIILISIFALLFILNGKIDELKKESERLSQLEDKLNSDIYALKEDVPTKISQLENDNNYIEKTEYQKLLSESQTNDSRYVTSNQFNAKYNELLTKISNINTSSGGGSTTIINQTTGIEYDDIKTQIRDDFFPVGSLYCSMDKDFDPNIAWGGTWVKISEGNFIEATEDETKIGSHVDAGLPNATLKFETWRPGGSAYDHLTSSETTSGFGSGSMWGGDAKGIQVFSLNKASSIYKDGVTTVQPNAFYAYIWRREN